MAKIILLGSPVKDSEVIKSYTSDSSILPGKFQSKTVQLNRSISVPAMMNKTSVV